MNFVKSLIIKILREWKFWFLQAFSSGAAEVRINLLSKSHSAVCSRGKARVGRDGFIGILYPSGIISECFWSALICNEFEWIRFEFFHVLGTVLSWYLCLISPFLTEIWIFRMAKPAWRGLEPLKFGDEKPKSGGRNRIEELLCPFSTFQNHS